MRAALGVSADAVLAVACDGRRSRVDDGLSMLELAETVDRKVWCRRGRPRPSLRPRSRLVRTGGTGEVVEVMVELGAESAINLDGGGSTTLVHRRHLLNRPYSTLDQPAPESRPIVSAIVFEPRKTG